MAPRRSVRVWLVRLSILLVLGALVGPHVWAWTRLRAARAALDGYRPDDARRNLDACARVGGWAGRPSVHLLLSRACRQDDDFERAAEELRTAQRLLAGATDDTAFEWALLQAAAGNVPEVEEFLQRRVEQSPESAGLVWEALVQGNLRVYRILDAMSCLRLWLDREPDNLRAIELRGQTYVTGKGVTRGVEDYHRVLELDPTREKTRWRLVMALIDIGSYQEAAEHLQVLNRKSPDDPKGMALLARCYNFIGRRDEARALLDAALTRFPDDGLSLRTRGQIALMDDQKPEAERWLRRAADAMPEDYQAQWMLFEALRQQDKLDEAKVQQVQADRVKDQVSRLGELQSRKLAEFPLDPALHYEMGTLLTQTGRGDVGERWFLSAVSLDPDHQPSHAALTRYYQAKGDAAKAAFHRERADAAANKNAAVPPR